MTNPNIATLEAYPFERMNKLFEGAKHQASLPLIKLSIGEPKHASPAFALNALVDNLPLMSNYPATKGLPELRQAIAEWIDQRYQAEVSADSQILPVNGTREALFSLIQALVDDTKPKPLVAFCNPFYQIYEGAAKLANATPLYLACKPENDWIPDLSALDHETLDNIQVLIICSPGNPTGACYTLAQYQEIILLAEKHNFVVISDECYSEIYREEKGAPIGLFDAYRELGRRDFANGLVVNSLSKRSNLPGLRSGFVAGDTQLISDYFQYRTYHGCAMSLPTQHASIAAWRDEEHVSHSRKLYDEKYRAFCAILAPNVEVNVPDASFYVWLNVKGDDQAFARALFEQQHVVVLPGSFLSREVDGSNPGEGYVRIALVADVEECREAAYRIATFMGLSTC